jgi:hypothetical protein
MRLHAGLDKGTLREERLPLCLTHGAVGDRRIDPGSFAERPLDVIGRRRHVREFSDEASGGNDAGDCQYPLN